jgi:hypothetical protein
VALACVALIVLALAGYAVYNYASDSPPQVYCSLELYVTPDGHRIHQDVNRGCNWVDENGNPANPPPR